MKKILFTLFICLAFCALNSDAAPIKPAKSPESSVVVKEHHGGGHGGPAHGGHAMHGGGGHAMRPAGGPGMHHPGGRPHVAPPPRHHHHRGIVAPMYVGVSYANPYYYDPYYYDYYDPYYYTYPVRPVVRYRVPNVGFSVMF